MSKLLSRAEASKYLRDKYGLSYTTGTLAKFACSQGVYGEGPPFKKFGKWPKYTQEDLDAWVDFKLNGGKQ